MARCRLFQVRATVQTRAALAALGGTEKSIVANYNVFMKMVSHPGSQKRKRRRWKEGDASLDQKLQEMKKVKVQVENQHKDSSHIEPNILDYRPNFQPNILWTHETTDGFFQKMYKSN